MYCFFPIIYCYRGIAIYCFLSPLQFLPSSLTTYPLWQLQILLCIVIEVLLYIVFSLTSAVSAVFADDVPTLAVTDIVMYCY